MAPLNKIEKHLKKANPWAHRRHHTDYLHRVNTYFKYRTKKDSIPETSTIIAFLREATKFVYANERWGDEALQWIADTKTFIRENPCTSPTTSQKPSKQKSKQ